MSHADKRHYVKLSALHIASDESATLLVPATAGSDGEFENQGETAILRTDDPKSHYQAVADVFGSAPPGSSTHTPDKVSSPTESGGLDRSWPARRSGR